MYMIGLALSSKDTYLVSLPSYIELMQVCKNIHIIKPEQEDINSIWFKRKMATGSLL